MEVSVTNLRSQQGIDTATFEVWIKGQDKTIVKFVTPRRDYGKCLLMVMNNLWLYTPTINNPIRISPHQRLLGQIAYGDIARTYFSRDYSPKLLREEKIEGQDAYLLELKAKNSEVAYNKVLYWVEKYNFSPLKAEFFTVSGRLMKTAYYQGRQNDQGKMMPQKITIRDAIKEGEYSIMEFNKIEKKEFLDSIFNKEYLKQIS